MQALGEERECVVETTQKLDTSLKEREQLLVEVAEAKAKVQQYYHTHTLDVNKIHDSGGIPRRSASTRIRKTSSLCLRNTMTIPSTAVRVCWALGRCTVIR